MGINRAIASILRDIPAGKIFDSHFVISQLIRHNSDAYFDYIRHTPGDTASVHGLLSQEIATFEPNFVFRHGPAWSENIHGTASECMSWELVRHPPASLVSD